MDVQQHTAHFSPCTSFLKVTWVFPNTKLSIWARTTASQYGGGYSQISTRYIRGTIIMNTVRAVQYSTVSKYNRNEIGASNEVYSVMILFW